MPFFAVTPCLGSLIKRSGNGLRAAGESISMTLPPCSLRTEALLFSICITVTPRGPSQNKPRLSWVRHKHIAASQAPASLNSDQGWGGIQGRTEKWKKKKKKTFPGACSEILASLSPPAKKPAIISVSLLPTRGRSLPGTSSWAWSNRRGKVQGSNAHRDWGKAALQHVHTNP